MLGRWLNEAEKSDGKLLATTLMAKGVFTQRLSIKYPVRWNISKLMKEVNIRVPYKKI